MIPARLRSHFAPYIFFAIGVWGSLLLCATPSFSQLNNTAFHVTFPIDSARKNTLSFEFHTLGFFKNNEFDNQIVKGYTLFGYQCNPRLRYQVGAHLSVEGGLFLRKDFGAEGYHQIAPTFTVKYQKEGFSMIFGNLEGALAHRLLEPLYDFENVIDNKLENGIQFKLEKTKWDVDAWVDWRKMIYQNAPFQEEISGGFRTFYRLWQNENARLKVGFQGTVYHWGGQIDTVAAPVVSAWNYAPGFMLDVGRQTKGYGIDKRALPKFRIEGHYIGFFRDAFVPRLAFDNGQGWYANFSYYSKIADGMISYWSGERYLSVLGGDLFSSQSRIEGRVDALEEPRQLLFVRFMKEIRLAEGTNLSVRFQPYINLNTRVVEYYYGLYLNSNLSFALWKQGG